MSRYRLLVLATRHAVPPDSGYATDVFCSIQQLQIHGVDVRVILLNDGKAHTTSYPASLVAGTARLPACKPYVALGKALITGQPFVACKWSAPEVVSMARALYEDWPFDLIQAAGSFHMVNALAIKRCCGAKVVMRAQNVEHSICERMAKVMEFGPRRAIWRREGARLRAAEGAWCRAADMCLPISENDRALLQSLAPRTPMFTIQAGAGLHVEKDADIAPSQPPCFLHVGSLEWTPRMEGLLWFLKEVWPLARSHIPGVRLAVAGSVSAANRARLNRWEAQGVEVRGFVEDLGALANRCAAVVVPMRCGGGIKIRVITAWANGWPVIGTRLMGEGLPVEHEINCLMADEPADLAKHMCRLCADPGLRRRLIEGGWDVHRRQFSWDAVGRSMLAAHEFCLNTVPT